MSDKQFWLSIVIIIALVVLEALALIFKMDTDGRFLSVIIGILGGALSTDLMRRKYNTNRLERSNSQGSSSRGAMN